MQKEELRIGNWVTENGRLIHIHDGFGIDHAQNFKPIPLTEERLLKFGFEKWFGEFIMSGFPFVIYRNEIWTDTDSDDDAICRVDFVHELQNFFFAVKRKELEINIDALQ